MREFAYSSANQSKYRTKNSKYQLYIIFRIYRTLTDTDGVKLPKSKRNTQWYMSTNLFGLGANMRSSACFFFFLTRVTTIMESSYKKHCYIHGHCGMSVDGDGASVDKTWPDAIFQPPQPICVDHVSILSKTALVYIPFLMSNFFLPTIIESCSESFSEPSYKHQKFGIHDGWSCVCKKSYSRIFFCSFMVTWHRCTSILLLCHHAPMSLTRMTRTWATMTIRHHLPRQAAVFLRRHPESLDHRLRRSSLGFLWTTKCSWMTHRPDDCWKMLTDTLLTLAATINKFYNAWCTCAEQLHHAFCLFIAVSLLHFKLALFGVVFFKEVLEM